ncbi:hypothetical protein VFPBJ_11266 [Purpureocillium lilacinum]|uniref:Uncharacterized protein n=1 Tax=Purpureocillium lilacinum TaxID=33203 RepID=A0A179FF96_PURLI|nr:hypothetical protein VFPBJ_11266 [Purpureocillium lilacinum]
MLSFLGPCSLIPRTDSPALRSFPEGAQRSILGTWSSVGQCEAVQLRCYALTPVHQSILSQVRLLLFISLVSLPPSCCHCKFNRRSDSSHVGKRDKFPILVCLYSIMSSLADIHHLQRKRKFLTASAAWPQLHWSVPTALMLCRYLLSLHFPVRQLHRHIAKCPCHCLQLGHVRIHFLKRPQRDRGLGQHISLALGRHILHVRPHTPSFLSSLKSLSRSPRRRPPLQPPLLRLGSCHTRRGSDSPTVLGKFLYHSYRSPVPFCDGDNGTNEVDCDSG